MVLGNEAPVARVGTVVAVVALHPVVIHLEGIFLCLLAVYQYAAVVGNLQVVALVNAYGALVDGQVLHGKPDGLALGRNPDGTVVVACPSRMSVQGIQETGLLLLVVLYACHQVGTCLKGCFGLGGERHVAKVP